MGTLLSFARTTKRDHLGRTWQVWSRGGDGRWSPIGAPRATFHEAWLLARLLSAGREVAVVPSGSRPIASV
jgi:hypothetical protein